MHGAERVTGTLERVPVPVDRARLEVFRLKDLLIPVGPLVEVDVLLALDAAAPLVKLALGVAKHLVRRLAVFNAGGLDRAAIAVTVKHVVGRLTGAALERT